MNPTLDKTLSNLIYGSLMILALGLVTSTSLLALSHILMLIPILYFLSKSNFKEFPKSAWALLAMILIIILSVLMNQDIAVNGYKPVFKAKYFLFGFLSIAPLYWFFKNHFSEKKISWLLYAFCIATTVATASGLCGTFFGYSPLHRASVPMWGRYGGFFGMVMNYGHNISYFLILISGMLVFRKKLERYISSNFLIFVFIINLMGLFFSYTRGAWIGFLAGVPFFFFKNNKKWFGIAILGIILAGVIAYFSAGKMMENRARSNNERISQWEASVKAFQERPLLGYGYLNFEQLSSEIKQRYGIRSPEFRGHAHNNLFEMLGATGGLGLIAFTLWITFWFVEMYKRGDFVSTIVLGYIVTFFFGGLTQSTISLGINLFFIMAVYACSMVNLNSKTSLVLNNREKV